MYLGPKVIGNFKKKTRRKGAAEKRTDKVYLAKIRSLRCCVCNAPPPSQVHHLKCAGGRGMSKRAADKWGVPLCNECHINGVERVGSKMEVAWFRGRGVDCLALAAALYSRRHSLAEMEKVLVAHGT